MQLGSFLLPPSQFLHRLHRLVRDGLLRRSRSSSDLLIGVGSSNDSEQPLIDATTTCLHTQNTLPLNGVRLRSTSHPSVPSEKLLQQIRMEDEASSSSGESSGNVSPDQQVQLQLQQPHSRRHAQTHIFATTNEKSSLSLNHSHRRSHSSLPRPRFPYRRWLQITILSLAALFITLILFCLALSTVVPLWHSYSTHRCDGVSIERFFLPKDSPEHPLKCFPNRDGGAMFKSEQNRLPLRGAIKKAVMNKENQQIVAVKQTTDEYPVPNIVHFIYGLAGEKKRKQYMR